jgi:hypothetical protein
VGHLIAAVCLLLAAFLWGAWGAGLGLAFVALAVICEAIAWYLFLARKPSKDPS